MECKDCGSTDFYEKEIIDSLGRPHTQIRCQECDGWITTKKRPENIGKTKQDYIKEHMSNEPATDKQVNYMTTLYKKNRNNKVKEILEIEHLENIISKKITVSKFEASNIIDKLVKVVSVERRGDWII
jgi:metal-responsive CopG/Arc/MetJ family transcriptional regulator